MEHSIDTTTFNHVRIYEIKHKNMCAVYFNYVTYTLHTHKSGNYSSTYYLPAPHLASSIYTENNFVIYWHWNMDHSYVEVYISRICAIYVLLKLYIII